MPLTDAANEAITSDEGESFVSATSSPTSWKSKPPLPTLPTKPKPIPAPKPAALSPLPAPSTHNRANTEAASTDATSMNKEREKPPAQVPRPKTAVRPQPFSGRNPPASRSQYYPNAMPYGNSVVAAPAQPIPIRGGPSGFTSGPHRPPPRPSPKSTQSSMSQFRGKMEEVPLKTMTEKGMSLDNLANAMVASNLATSRTASRTASPLYPSNTGGSRRAPAPPPARRSGGSILDSLKPSSHRRGRADSPSKEPQKRKMMTTLRKEKSEDDGKYKTKGLIKKKHPNKHHEGDRKRWRDTVSDRERKRYEGLWASNKGLWIGQPTVNSPYRVSRSEPRALGIDSVRTSSYYGEQPYEVDRDPYLRDRNAQSVPMLARGPPHPYSSQQNPSTVSLGGAGPYSHPLSQGNLSSLSLATASGSNSGSYTSSPQRTSPSRYNTPFDNVEPQVCVCSLVVRDIWSRSRLPPDVLSDIWDLVDRTDTGMLCKDEFCAGLWLIDQRLKGRKLPQRVGDSVWRSFGGMANIKVKDYGGKVKKGHESESGRRS